MPIFQVTASDGATYEVDAVTGTSREELLARIEAYENIGREDTSQEEYTAQLDRELKEAQAAATKEAAEAEEGSLLGDILQSPAAGAVDLLEYAALGAIAPLGEGAETSARDVVKSVADFVRPEISNPDNVIVQVGKGLGSLGALLPAAFLGPAALPVMAGISMAAGAGEASERARTAGASVEDIGTAALKGVIPGAFDVIPAGRFAKLAGIDIGDIPIIGDMINKLGPQVVKGAKDRVQRALVSGSIEGAQEAAQNVAQNLIEQGYNPDAATFGGTLEEGLLGGSVGVIAQGLIDLVVGRRGPSAPTAPPAPTAPTAPPADIPTLVEGQEQGELFRGLEVSRAPDKEEELRSEIASNNEEITKLQSNLLSGFETGASFDVMERIQKIEDRNALLFRDAEARKNAIPVDDPRSADAEQQIGTYAEEEIEALRPAYEQKARAVTVEGQVEPTEFENEVNIRRDTILEQGDLTPEGEYVIPLGEATTRARIDAEEAQRRATPTISDPRQDDFIDIAETAQLEEMVVADEALRPQQVPIIDETIRAQQGPVDEAFRPESELETIGGQLDTQQQQETAAKRGAILDSVLTDLRSPDPEIARRRFVSALKNEGITNTAPTGPELRTIKRATDVVTATRAEAEPEKARAAIVEGPEYQMQPDQEGNLRPVPRTEIPEVRGREEGPRSRLEKVTAEVAEKMPAFQRATAGTQDGDVEFTAIGEQLELDLGDTAAPVKGRAASAKEDIKPTVKGRAASAKEDVKLKTKTKFERPKKLTPRQQDIRKQAAARKKQGATTVTLDARVAEAATNSAGISDYILNDENKDVIRLTEEQLHKVDPAVDPDSPIGQRLTVKGFIPATEESLKEETAKKGRTQGQNEELKEFTEVWGRKASNNLKMFMADMDVRSYLNKRLQRVLLNNPDPLIEEDIRKVRGLLEGTIKDGGATRLFFIRQPDPVNGLVEIAYALTGDTRVDLTGMSEVAKAYHGGLNSNKAEAALTWVKNNLSEGAYSWVLSYNTYLTGGQSVEQAKRGDTRRYLAADAVAAVDVDAHPMMGAALIQGDIKGALRIIAATTANKRLTNAAKRLGNKLGDTKVEVVENLTDELGVPMAGRFDPKTNTIRLDAETGINTHTVLHETTHALTSATLANKSHPTTKKLQKLFDEIQDSIGNVYGSRNLDEFVAETFGNHEFQRLLGGINPKGGIVTAFQRFANIITNFVRSILRIPTKAFKPESVLDKTEGFVNAILAPAPEYRDAGAMNLDAASVINRMGEFAKGIGKPTIANKKAFLQSLSNLYDNVGVDAKSKKLVAYVAPLQALGDMAKRYGINAAYKLEIAIRNMVGAQGRSDTALDATATNMTNWLKGKPDPVKKAFNNLVYTSTRNQVDPYALRSKYKGNEVKLKVWDDMNKKGGDVKTIGESGKKIYTELRRVYAKQIKQLEEVLNKRIDEMEDAEGNPLKKDAKEQLKSSIFDKIFAKNRIEPYFPLTREGDLWVKFEGTDPVTGTPETVYMAFKWPSQRNNFVRNLKTDPAVPNKSIQQYSSQNKMVNSARDHTASTSFVGQTLKLLNDANVSKEVETEFLQIFLHTMPESSFAKQLIRRGNEGAGELGFVEDAEQAFRQRAYDMGAQIARMEHSSKIDGVMLEVEKEFKALQENTSEDQTSAQIFTEELRARARFAKNPPNDMKNKLAAQANRVAFIGTIGFNASSAIVNATQIPLMMYPILIGKYGIGPATKAMGRSMGLIKGSGTTRMLTNLVGDNTVKARGSYSIDNYFQENANGNLSIRDVYLPNKRKALNKDQIKELEDLKVLVELARDQGQLNRSLFYDTLGVEMSGRAKDVWDKTNAYSAFMFHQVERFNRQVAMTAVYQLDLQRLRGKDPNKTTETERNMSNDQMRAAAAGEALYKAQEMNGGAFLATAPRVAQTDIGRVAMMYKTFGVQMYYTILKTGKIAFSDADPDVRREAQKQLTGIVLASVAMSGVQGIPMIGAVMLAANMLLDDEEEDAETLLRQYIGEGWYKGGINALTGVDVANRVGMGNLLFRLNPYAQNQSPEEIAMQAVGGPAWSVGSQIVRGVKDMMSGELQRGIENTLPAAFRNIAKTYRYSGLDAGGINTRKGNPIYDDVTTGELLFQLFGFAPTGYTLAMDINRSIKEIERGTVLRRKKALDELYMSIALGSGEDVDDAIKEVIDYNDRHPSWAISGKSIIKSMNMRYKTTALMHNGVTVNPRLRADLLAHSNDYWGSNDYNVAKLLDF